MKIRNLVRSLITIVAFTCAAQAGAAPTLIVSNGVLTGAKGLIVEGALYDVAFAGGSCNSVFGGCSESRFQFHTEELAESATRALVSNVLVDGPLGNFDREPITVNGCIYYFGSGCLVVVPFSAAGVRFDAVAFQNGVVDSEDYLTGYNSGADYRFGDVFAVFQLATPDAVVPEPGSMGLLGLALAGLALARRRKS